MTVPCNYSPFSASGPGKAGLTVLRGATVTVATATGVINIRDGSVTGPIVLVIPIGAAAGAIYNLFGGGVRVNSGLYVEFNGGATGSINVGYE